MLRAAGAGRLSGTKEVIALRDLFSLSEGRTNDVVTVEAAGDVDLLTAPVFEGGVERALRQHPQRLVLDLTKVTFFSSRGVDVLESAAAGAAARGVQLVIRTSNCVDRIVDLVGPDPVRRACTRRVQRERRCVPRLVAAAGARS